MIAPWYCHFKRFSTDASFFSAELSREGRQLRSHWIRLVLRALLNDRPFFVWRSVATLSIPSENEKHQSSVPHSFRKQNRLETFQRSGWIRRSPAGSGFGMRFPPIVRFRRICWFSKCSLQYSQTVCELTEAGIAFNKAVFWQCIKQKEIGVVVEVASTTNGELMAFGGISSAFHVSEEWDKFGPVEIGKRADFLFTPTQSFQFVLFHLAHQFTQLKTLSGFRFKSYRNLKRRPAYHSRSDVALMPPLQQTLIRIFCIKKLERHSETSVLIYWGRNLLFGSVQEKLYSDYKPAVLSTVSPRPYLCVKFEAGIKEFEVQELFKSIRLQ